MRNQKNGLIPYLHSKAASAFFIVFVAVNLDSYIVLASSPEEIEAKKAALKKELEELPENREERRKVDTQNSEDRETHSKNEPDSAQELADWNEYIHKGMKKAVELINWIANNN